MDCDEDVSGISKAPMRSRAVSLGHAGKCFRGHRPNRKVSLSKKMRGLIRHLQLQRPIKIKSSIVFVAISTDTALYAQHNLHLELQTEPVTVDVISED
jgi:hypothetical protein